MLEVAGRRHEHAARALNRLGDERRDRLRAFGEDQLLEIVRQLLREVGVAHAGLGFPEPVRRRRVADHRQREIEVRVHAREAGEPAGHDRDTVVAAMARDDLLLLGPAEDVVVVPDDLDLGVVRVRARAAEEDLRHPRRRERDQPLGEERGRFRAHRGERVVVAELVGVLLQRVADLGPAVADVDAPEPGHPVDVALAVEIAQPRPVALDDDARRARLLVLVELGERVEDEPAVGLLDRRRVGGSRLYAYDCLLGCGFTFCISSGSRSGRPESARSAGARSARGRVLPRRSAPRP